MRSETEVRFRVTTVAHSPPPEEDLLDEGITHSDTEEKPGSVGEANGSNTPRAGSSAGFHGNSMVSESMARGDLRVGEGGKGGFRSGG